MKIFGVRSHNSHSPFSCLYEYKSELQKTLKGYIKLKALTLHVAELSCPPSITVTLEALGELDPAGDGVTTPPVWTTGPTVSQTGL